MIGPAGEIAVTFEHLPSHENLERVWRELEARSDSSFFTSWSWIGCWLAGLPPGLRPRLLRAQVDGHVIGLGILVARARNRHGWMSAQGLFLHTTGDPILDNITIEYNGFLTDRTRSQQVVHRFIEFLVSAGGDWEELYIDGTTKAGAYKDITLPGVSLLSHLRQYHYVDLDAVRVSGKEYMASIGKDARYNIRRSLKEYQKFGDLVLDVAVSVSQALEFLAELKALHQAYWRSKSKPGAFADRSFELFHDHLIRTRFDHNEIQLVRISAGSRVLGYLYNLNYLGYVYHYQSGIDYAVSEKYSPGLVCHHLAIEYNSMCGHRVYDLMAGDARYKRLLGTHAGEMEWLVWQRDRLKFRVEKTLRKIKHRLRRKAAVPEGEK